MNIRISKLTMQNFKCFREKEITFDSNITTIRGRNGVGKTTIADAIIFCLFGKNTAGQSDLEIFKTRDNDGKTIHNLDYSVEIELNSDEHITNLKRSIKEVWVKKRGSEESVFKNNTVEYFVNGESYTKADYEKYIASMISEDVFRAITNPTYFPNQKWQDQRAFLTKMVGSIEPEVIANTGDLAKLVSLLDDSNDDIISYRKHLSYQIKQIKDKLDKIPVRLEEQNKALPELLDWDSIEAEKKNVEIKLAEVEEKILSIKSGNGQDVRKEELRKQLDEIYNRMRQRTSEIEKENRDKRSELDNKISELQRKFTLLLNDQRDIEAFLQSHDTLIKRCQETLDQCEKDAQQIRDEWSENNKLSLEWREADSVCPTCGQYLPHEFLQEKKANALANINKRKADTKAALTERANKVKALRADTEQEIKNLEQKKADTEAKLTEAKEAINTTFAEKQEFEKQKAALPSFDVLLASDTEYMVLSNQVNDLKNQINNICASEDEEKELDDLTHQKSSLNEGISSLSAKLATRTQYDKGLALIDGIKEEEKDLVKQLSELERKEDVARQYESRQNAILEERINQQFKLVKWKMFKTTNNGGEPYDEPWCECYVNGNPYHAGLNDAAKLNAGLDIINTLCNVYKVSAPITIDNSESTINIIETIGQQIRLQVFDSDLSLV